MKYYVDIVSNITENLVVYKCHTFMEVFLSDKSDSLLQNISKMFSLTLPTGNDNIYGVSNHSELNDEFNNLKTSATNALLIAFKYARNRNQDDPKKKTVQQYQCPNLVKILRDKTVQIIKSLYSIYKEPSISLNAIQEIQSLNEVFTISFKFLSKLVEEVEYYDIFSEVGKTLLIHIIFVNLLFQPTDKEIFENNEKEFCEISHDLCYEQQSKTIKSYSMALLENMCDKIDYFFSYCSLLTLNLEDVILSGMSAEEAFSTYPNLLDLKDTKFFNSVDPERQLDVCILVTAAVSFIMIMRPEIW